MVLLKIGHGSRERARRLGTTILLTALVLLGAASTASASNIYWYGEGNSSCWQTGFPGSSSSSCDGVGANFLQSSSHLVNGGIAAQIALSTSGDYCGYYRIGEGLVDPDANNESGNTGFQTPTPFSSYQEGNAYETVCQVSGAQWGQELRDTSPGNGCNETCGMNHYVSFGSQGHNDRPWSEYLGEPTLVVSAEAGPEVFTHSGEDVGAWGYLCPVFQDVTTGGVLEYCLQEWRSQYNTARWSEERIGSCAGNGSVSIDTVQSMFWPGTSFASERSGSANTFVLGSAGVRYYTAGISRSDLENAIKRDNTAYVQGENAGEPAAGKGCGRGLSTNPANYALIGVEQGTEGWRDLVELGGRTGNLQLHTEFTPSAPAASTSSASSVQFKRAELNGSVNANAVDTHYHFEYGTEAGHYVSSTPEVDAGSGTSGVSESAVITGLQQSTTYHYRIVASSEGGTTYGNEESLTTATAPVLSISNRFQSSMTLSWSASAGASSYSIKRDGVAIASTTGLAYVDTKLHATTFYAYEIVGNDANESVGSSTVTRATTPLNTVTMDVNGDGKTDLSYLYPGGYIDSFLSEGNGVYEKQSEQIGKEFDSTSGLWLAGDFNGDGKTDLVYIYPGGYIDTFFSEGNGTYEEKTEQVSKEFNDTEGTWEVGDFNGDGKADLVYIVGQYIDTFFSNGNGTYEEKSEEVSKEFSSTGGTWEVGDFNGDGKADLVYIINQYIDTFLSKGNGTYEGKSEEVSKEFSSTGGTWEVGDFNGDGKSDLAYIINQYIDTFFSNGKGTYEGKSEEVSKEFSSTGGTWEVGDFNGDGKADLVYIINQYIDTFLSKGKGTYEGKSEEVSKEFNSTSGQWRTGDPNDDGKTSLFYIVPGGYIDTFFSNGNGTYESKQELISTGFDTVSGLWL